MQNSITLQHHKLVLFAAIVLLVMSVANQQMPLRNSGSAIYNASVWLDGSLAGTTDPRGSLASPTTYPPAQHTYYVAATGYQGDEGTWIISSKSRGYFTARLTLKDRALSSPVLTLVSCAPGTGNAPLAIECPPSVPASFTVHAMDASTGGPISGAQVYLDEHYIGTTDSNGNIGVSTAPPPPESHRLEVRASGYQDTSTFISLRLVNGGTFTVRMGSLPLQSTSNEVYFEGGEAYYLNPVAAGQTFAITFKSYGPYPLTVNWQGSSTKTCFLWVFCSDNFSPVPSAIQVAVGQFASFSVVVNLGTQPGTYALHFQVCYGACPGPLGGTSTAESPSPPVQITVVPSRSGIISPSAMQHPNPLIALPSPGLTQVGLVVSEELLFNPKHDA